MKKIRIIAHKEFIQRVRKRSFLVATFLLPLLIPTLIWGTQSIKQYQEQSETAREVWVLDPTETFVLGTPGNLSFVEAAATEQELKELVIQGEVYAFLHVIPPGIEDPTEDNLPTLRLYTAHQPGMQEVERIRSYFNRQIRKHKLQQAGISEAMQALTQLTLPLSLVSLERDGKEKNTHSTVSFLAGYILSLLIYMFIFMYGAQVMQSVIEEKTGKVIELMLSLVRPWELMLGKLWGIARVGILQFGIWIVMFAVFTAVAGTYWGVNTLRSQATDLGRPEVAQAIWEQEDTDKSGFLAPQSKSVNEATEGVQQAWNAWTDLPLGRIALGFMLYFIAGFAFYGACFAAIGAAVDTSQEAQQFVFPLTIPLIGGLLGSMWFVMSDPGGSLSFWLSVIPFTSPIAMPARMPFGVPLWELALSVGVLIGSALIMVWLAGRIFRIGLLSQGNKVNFKTLIQWMIRG